MYLRLAVKYFYPKLIRLACILLIIAGCYGCSLFERRNTQDAVVTIGSNVLTRSTLDDITRSASDSIDSVRIAEDYIRQWAGDILFYEKATHDKNPEIEARVEQYRRELYTYEYEQRLIAQRMDKTIDSAEISAFYYEHRPMFILEEPMLKGLLIVVPNATPDIKKLKKWLGKHNEEIENIEKYAYNYCTGYELFTDRWLTATELRRHVPIAQQELSTLLKQQQQIDVQDSLQTYIIQITDKRLQGEEMPIEYAEPKIKKIILGEREPAFISEQKALFYHEADRLFRIKRAENEQLEE